MLKKIEEMIRELRQVSANTKEASSMAIRVLGKAEKLVDKFDTIVEAAGGVEGIAAKLNALNMFVPK